MEIDGFEYGRLRPAVAVPVRKRIAWLRRSAHGYAPQPYECLIAAYRADGLVQEANRVALAHQVARRRRLGWPGRVAGGVLLVTAGYGYRTWLALLWLGGLAAIGAFAFSRGEPVPRTAAAVPFSPFLYTMDLLLPIGDFGQEVAWRFDGHLQWLAWSCVLAGWLLTSAVVAGLARTVNR
jgi:hypothetical protein